MRADNNGEGGILALTALVSRGLARQETRRWWLVGLGIFGRDVLRRRDDHAGDHRARRCRRSRRHRARAASIHRADRRNHSRCAVRDPAHGHGAPGRSLRSGDGAVVHRPRRAGRTRDRTRSGRAGGVRPDLRRALRRGEPARRVRRLRCRRAGSHRNRGALRRHGAFRQDADPARMGVLRHAGAVTQLFRTGRAGPQRSRRHPEPVLPACAGVGPRAAADPRDRGGDHRVAGGDLRRVLADARGDPDGLLPPPDDPAHVGARDRPDLRAVHQLDAADRDHRACHRIPEFGQPRRCLRHRRDDGDADRLDPDLRRIRRLWGWCGSGS